MSISGEPRGKLPGTPAGLEITLDHVKVAGETVLTNDPDGAAKLQRLLNEWLALERGTFELAQKRAQPKPTSVDQEAPQRPEDLVPRFQVEVDTERTGARQLPPGQRDAGHHRVEPAWF